MIGIFFIIIPEDRPGRSQFCLARITKPNIITQLELQFTGKKNEKKIKKYLV